MLTSRHLEFFFFWLGGGVPLVMCPDVLERRFELMGVSWVKVKQAHYRPGQA